MVHCMASGANEFSGVNEMGKDKQLFEKPIWNALSQAADFAILNVLRIICSLTIVTLE